MKFDAKNPSLDKDDHSLYLGTINVIDAVFQSEENTEGKRRIAGEKNNPTAEKRNRQQK